MRSERPAEAANKRKKNVQLLCVVCCPNRLEVSAAPVVNEEDGDEKTVQTRGTGEN